MEESPWEANSHPASQEIPCLYGTHGYNMQTYLTANYSQVKVTLRPTISRSVSPGFEPHVGLVTGH
jgi:hypothetical protein